MADADLFARKAEGRFFEIQPRLERVSALDPLPGAQVLVGQSDRLHLFARFPGKGELQSEISGPGFEKFLPASSLALVRGPDGGQVFATTAKASSAVMLLKVPDEGKSSIHRIELPVGSRPRALVREAGGVAAEHVW